MLWAQSLMNFKAMCIGSKWQDEWRIQISLSVLMSELLFILFRFVYREIILSSYSVFPVENGAVAALETNFCSM